MLYIWYLCGGGRNTNEKLQSNYEKFYKISKKKEMSASLVGAGEGQGCRGNFLEEAMFELDFEG